LGILPRIYWKEAYFIYNKGFKGFGVRKEIGHTVVSLWAQGFLRLIWRGGLEKNSPQNFYFGLAKRPLFKILKPKKCWGGVFLKKKGLGGKGLVGEGPFFGDFQGLGEFFNSLFLFNKGLGGNFPFII